MVGLPVVDPGIALLICTLLEHAVSGRIRPCPGGKQVSGEYLERTRNPSSGVIRPDPAGEAVGRISAA